MTRRQFTLIGSSLPAAFLVGCAKSPVVPPGPNPPTPAPVDQLAALEGTVAALEATVAILGATGKIPANTAAVLVQVLAPLPYDIQQATGELQSADSSAQKAVKLNDIFYPQLMAMDALPANAKLYAATIEAAIKAFLVFYPVGTSTLPMAIHIVPIDKDRLTLVSQRAGVAWARLKALEAK